MHYMYLVIYLAHLVVPLVFVASSLGAELAGAGDNLDTLVIAVGTLWIVVGLGALVFQRDRRRFVTRMSGPLIVAYTLYLSVALMALGAEIWGHRIHAAPLAYPPGLKAVVSRGHLRLPGISPTTTYSVNELGLRGPSPPREGPVYRIVMVGGSTTECAALDDSQEWPHLVMQIMNDRQKQRFVWVGNAGVSATTTVDHLFWLKKLPVLSQADLLVFLIGINDLQAALDFGGEPTQRVLEYRAQRLTEHAAYGSDPEEAFFRRAWLFSLAKKNAGKVLAMLQRPRANSNREGAVPFVWAEHKRGMRPRSASQVPIPDLGVALKEYAQRIRSLESYCHGRGLRCVFLTQPVMWRDGLSADEENLLWMGWVGWKAHRRGLASPADLARSMNAYNQALLSVCREDRLECYDLASAIPADTSAFYDDCHFNVGGARMVAEFLAPRLLAAPPFGGAGDQGL